MSKFQQCEERQPTKVFSHYEFGDPLEVYARFIGEGDEAVPATDPSAITVYVRCEREAGHDGKHLARKTNGWDE